MKIFGIGFFKTGTTSLAAALETIGYSVVDGESTLRPGYGDEGRTLIEYIENGNFRFPIIERHDAFTDAPYFFVWRQLDKEFPNSKFVLTVRDDDEWISSVLRFYSNRPVQLLRDYFLNPCGDPTRSVDCRDEWLSRYRRHNREVMEYFKARPDDLLVMDLSKGDSWATLGKFLNQEVPDGKFPHANRHRGKLEQRMWSLCRNISKKFCEEILRRNRRG